MNMYRRTVKIEASGDVDGKMVQRGSSPVEFTDLPSISDFVFSSKQKFSIPFSDVDIMEGSGITTARVVYIETEDEIVVKIGSALSTGINISPLDYTEPKKRGILYAEGEFSGVFISSVGADGDVTVFVNILGQ